MGIQEQLRLTSTITKLNQVVSHSALASKFISLFYAELEFSGTLVYCNAGHTPPILVSPGGSMLLTRGGAVLGPNPDASYERGYVSLEPGSVLLAITDGITEAESRRGEPYGWERLEALVRADRWTAAQSLVNAVFESVREFSKRVSPVDDQTVVAVIRREGSPGRGAGARSALEE
jgi:sigma-B regulation protein RsbU (phosphoserine phosphatase)